MHGSIFLGPNIEPDLYGQRVLTCYLRLRTITVPNQRLNRDVFCQLAQISKRISENDLLNEDIGVRQWNPFLENSRRTFQHRRMVPESIKIVSLHQHFNFAMTSSEAMILAAMNAVLTIAWRSLKISGISTGFQPVTSRDRCYALNN